MSDLYLIAHKVRGKPAFDIAEHMTCPCCSTHDEITNEWVEPKGCAQCDDQGHWWIIPTSGHRAFPFWSETLYEFSFSEGMPDITGYDLSIVRDHYAVEREVATDLIKVLGLIHKPLAPVAPIKRRL